MEGEREPLGERKERRVSYTVGGEGGEEKRVVDRYDVQRALGE